MELDKIISEIKPTSRSAYRACIERFNSLAKPVGGLGDLEELIAQIAAITGSADIDISRKAVAVFCADNGVARQGVTRSGSEVTTAVAGLLRDGRASVSAMAETCGADVFPIDIGMRDTVDGLRNKKLMAGTLDISEKPAMTRETAFKAVEVGIDTVGELKAKGYRIIATGEVGMGNTTTSSAVCAVLLGQPVKNVTGRGAGLDDAGLVRKIAVIEKAIAANNPAPADVIGVLHTLGGLDIAAMTGVFLGGGYHKIPIVADGFISGTAALCAVSLCPNVRGYILPSHESGEAGAVPLMKELGFSPVIRAGLRLGEGTGAVALFPLLDMALSVYNRTFTLSDIF